MPVRVRTLARAHAPRQARLFAAADAASLAVDAAVRRVWRDLLTVIRRPVSPAHAHQRAAAVLRSLPAVVAGELRRQLGRLFVRGWRAAAATARAHRLREDDDDTSRRESDPLDLLPAPVQDLVRRLLDRFVRPADHALIGTDTDKRMPDALAHVLASSIALGETQQQTAKKLLPHFDGSRVRARRAARTFGLHVAHQGQVAAWRESFGPDLLGFQIHATLDSATRPEHRKRDGTKYYFDPKPGQKPMSECPDPPLEADGSISWNCRCWRSPLLA